MSRKVLVDLAMKLSANSAELRRGIDESRREMRRLNDTASNMGKQMTMAFAKVAAAFVAVRQGMRQMNDVMNSTMTTADRMRRVTDGLDGSMQAFNRSLATGDFSGFISNMRRAYQAAADYSDIMDEITKSQMALSIGDIGVARQIFELDQVIYGEDQVLNVVKAALDEKQRIYTEHYGHLEEMSERSRNALINNIMRTHDITMKTTQEAFEYFTRYSMFDQAREEAQRYFDVMDRMSRMATTESMAPGSYSAQDFSDVQFEADRIKDSLQGWARWLVDNNQLIDAMTPSMQDLIEVEKNYQQTLANRERVFAQLAREQFRINRRFRGETAGAPDGKIGPTDVFDPDFFYDALMPLINGDPFDMNIRIKAVIDKSQGDPFDPDFYYDALQPLIGGDPYDMGLEKLNTQLEESMEKFNIWGNVGSSAAHMIAASIMDMAMGVEQNIEDIIRNLIRMIGVQMISGMLMNMFAPGSGMIMGSMTGGSIMMGGIPQMASGGIAYGPSIVQVGEYPGARLDPEIISRASDLRSILGFDRGGMSVSVHGMLDGEDLYISNNRFSTRKSLEE